MTISISNPHRSSTASSVSNTCTAVVIFAVGKSDYSAGQPADIPTKVLCLLRITGGMHRPGGVFHAFPAKLFYLLPGSYVCFNSVWSTCLKCPSYPLSCPFYLSVSCSREHPQGHFKLYLFRTEVLWCLPASSPQDRCLSATGLDDRVNVSALPRSFRPPWKRIGDERHLQWFWCGPEQLCIGGDAPYPLR